MSIKTRFFLAVIGLCLVSSNFLFAAENKAEESLSKGKKFYADGRYEEAMDSFIDVFVSGNPDQISEANEYVNLIHFDRGGVVPPKQVPYNKEIEDRQNIGVQGKNLFDKEEPKQANPVTQEKQPALKEIYLKEKEEADIPEPPSSVPEANPFEKPEIVAEAPVEEEVKEDVKAEGEKDVKPQKQPEATKVDAKDATTPVAAETAAATGVAVAPVVAAKTGKADDKDDKNKNADKTDKQDNKEPQKDTKTATQETEAAPVAAVPQETIVAEDDTFPKGSKSKVRALQRQKEEEKRLEMRDDVIAKLRKKKDVQVYMRAGKVDAVDIPSDILFRDRAINQNASEILDGLYALMILENAPAYYILPEGSYTDDVTIQGVRQAVTLNSYLVNRGISPSKMNLNMGLSTQEPPEKFRDLAGVSVVFDYDGKSRLYSKLEEKNLPPILSLAVYPFKEIIPAWGEVFVIDFSVIEASAPVKEWSLQIVSHDIDKHFYVVKQFSGKGPLTHQVFWNGKKRYFGQELPAGDYTVVLRAVDSEKRERILKRKVTIKEAPQKLETEYIKTEAEVAKAEKQEKAKEQAATKNGELNYNQKRLWNKPAKKKMGGAVATPAETTPAVTTQENTAPAQDAEQKAENNAAESAPQENKEVAAAPSEDINEYDFE